MDVVDVALKAVEDLDRFEAQVRASLDAPKPLGLKIHVEVEDHPAVLWTISLLTRVAVSVVASGYSRLGAYPVRQLQKRAPLTGGELPAGIM